MRKNNVRKFIHAALDCLPLLIIPIFAIYSMNHEINDYSINTSGYEVNVKYETNEVTLFEDVEEDKIYHNDNLNLYAYADGYEFKIRIYQGNLIANSSHIGDELVFSSYNSNEENYLEIYFNSYEIYTYFTNTNGYFSAYFDNTEEDPYILFTDVDYVVTEGIEDYLEELQDYTDQLPTSSDFKVYDVEWNDGIVLNDTDIGSQLMYCLYNTTDKYFNMNRVFNLGNIWNWVSNTLFGGQPPISAYIVYNIIAYEFIMDVIFLLYSVFMFIIDFAEKCLDRFMGRANRC